MCCSAKMDEERKKNQTLRIEPIKCVDFLSQQPALGKYQYKMSDKQDNLQNIKILLSSKIFGGSVLAKRMDGKKNSLKSQITGDLAEFGPRIKNIISSNAEKFFHLENIQLKPDQPEFVDAWILINSIKDPEHKKKIDALNALSEQKLSNWQPQMLYPYKHKFLYWDDIKEALTGYGRFIYYRAVKKTVGKDKDGNAIKNINDFDPSVKNNTDNWLLTIKEGRFHRGKAEGYQRQLFGFNGHCKLGYFFEDEPYGKFVEYDIQGKEWAK